MWISMAVVIVVLLVIFLLFIFRRFFSKTKTNSADESNTNDSNIFPENDIENIAHLRETTTEQIENDTLPPTEKYNTNSFVYTLDIAISTVLSEYDASPSVVQKALNTGYHQAAKLVEHMEYMGIVGPSIPPLPRKIFIPHVALYREKLKKILLSYSTSLEISTVISLFAKEVESLISQHLSEIEIVDLMNGLEFEQWCARLLKKLDYINISLTTRSGDQGVDILAEKEDVHFAVQCKCHSSALGNTPIQEVYAGQSLYHCHVGIVMTNQYFTSGARELAEATNVLLWNRSKLIELINRVQNVIPFPINQHL